MHVIFDLDGTLTDPYEGISRSVAHALEQMSKPALSIQRLRSFIGPPLQDSFASLGFAGDDVALAVELYRGRYSELGLYENQVYAGIPEVLEALATSGTTMAVATSKPLPIAERILNHFNLSKFFTAIAGATLDGSRSSKADVISFALARLDARADDARMVGDREQDILGAQQNQMPSIGVGWGYAEPGELEAAGADAIVATPRELVRLLGDGSAATR